MKWLSKISSNNESIIKNLLKCITKLAFIALLPYLITNGLVEYFAEGNNQKLNDDEKQHITLLLSEIADNSDPKEYFNKEFNNLVKLPFPSEAFDRRIKQIIDKYPDAFSLHFYDDKGLALSLPFAQARSRVVAQRFLECTKNSELEKRYERFLHRFSGYTNAHRTLNGAPDSIVTLGNSHDNQWGGWYQLRNENGELTGELILFISKEKVLKSSPINNAILKAQALYGRNYKFAWQDPVKPNELLPENHDFSLETIEAINKIPYGENLFTSKGKIGVKIFTNDGAAIIAQKRQPIDREPLFMYLDSILGIIAIIVALLLTPTLLNISTFETGIKVKISTLILFGISLPLSLLAFIGIAERNEQEIILTNKYELQNVEELKRIDEGILANYNDIEKNFKNSLEMVKTAEVNNNISEINSIFTNCLSENAYIKKIVYVRNTHALIYDENSQQGKKVKISDDSISHYGHSLINSLNGEYEETTEIGATDKNSVMQNMSSWLNRYLLLDSGKMNILSLLSTSSLTYTDFIFNSQKRALAAVFIFMNDHSLQNHYLYKISKLRDEILSKNPKGTKFAAIPTSSSVEWLSFPKRATAKNETLNHIAKLTSKSRIPAHIQGEIAGKNYLITSTFGHNLYGYSLILARPYDIIIEEINGLKIRLTMLLLSISILAILASYFSSSLLVEPIGTLKVGLESISNGVFLTNLKDSNVKEFSLMVSTLNNTMHQLKELEVAKSVQETLLPLEGLQGKDWCLFGKSCPATQLGGDHMEWLSLKDGRILIIIGDVTGHGIAPAMIQASIKVWLALNAEKATDSTSLINTINKMHISHGVRRFFMTAWFGYYTPSTGALEFSSAGHPYPFLLSNTSEIKMLTTQGMPIGSALNLRLKGFKTTLQPNEYLILYTDGFAEVENHKGEILGFDRFGEICSSIAGLNAQQAIEAIYNKVAQWGPQNDDQTLIILQRKGHEKD